MNAVRDSQRARVYDADQLVRNAFERADTTGVRQIEVFGSHLTLPVERKFASIESVQSYVQKVLALGWIQQQWPQASVPVAVRARAGQSAAHYERTGNRAVIAVPTHVGSRAWALRELVVLHELAHHLQSPDDEEAAHGPQFCGRYVELVDGVLGAEAAFLLRTTLAECGVALG
ncbi:TIGR04338 family metallohydrolase [Skermania sp. ID1734]|uniref:TIGR04338 family metallohydrolase n=1 Tax=Skermania sp. ID1734 TaxID=2597516 RepID=UPI0011807971|nr:TIGR04338 family metallohydrolase [Skermania sp. ID1734]TSD99305.1 TIGR04338 family metallohydrolase [Skermania sp. ID1734]